MIFGNKYVGNAVKFGNKLGSSVVSFGNKYHPVRKIANTLHTLNNIAGPALGIGSALQPELAPLLGTIGAVGRGVEGVSRAISNYSNF